MDRHERLTAILDMLSDQGSITVHQAVNSLDASAATIRRDLEHLASQQLLTRTRGGAVASTVSYDLPLRYKAGRQAPEKERIARAVIKHIRPGAIVGLNGGTTTTNVARAIATRDEFHDNKSGPGITVVTNALNIASELAVRPHIKVVVVGGVVRQHSYEIIGPLAERLLDVVAVDVAVLGVDSVDPEHGAMAYDDSEAAINALLARHADTVIVAADSSKLGKRAFAHILPAANIDILITDTSADDAEMARLRDAGIQVVQA
ncbi:DeoR/GlpR transcriptional regulator [Actinobacteria bacterium YIM 96077]|uniref:Alkaline phosphatase n=1 Tax=Phytoactinopolyspora halophila TaxID=1981511 RepID=A0A329QZV2_9ACTN|nr:DeoR/GlpR family DNA-binding transcription regulator [Phytoactinopolyspora halophila]AYY11687.1 DeoR/GlpR transcriptional regulator [Actinobacteria bacterium YIM 96077]RAW17880.1 alkaline phosphatase [Phytoactinopolyspora halophila]